MSSFEAVAAAFDGLAGTYDSLFGAGVIGRHLRAAVQRRLQARFQAGDRILEINCGTGEDARFLAAHGMRIVATDVSPQMLAIARRRIEQAGLADRVELRTCPIEAVTPALGAFDGLLSNFGGLNCVASLEDVLPRLASVVRPGGFAVCSVMGPYVPWEWAWFVAQGRPSEAFRRLRAGGVAWRGIRVRYPRIKTLARAAAPWFVRRRVAALGCLLPPTYVEGWAARYPRGIDLLARLERRIETWRPCPSLSDHYLIELQRTSQPATGVPAERSGGRA